MQYWKKKREFIIETSQTSSLLSQKQIKKSLLLLPQICVILLGILNFKKSYSVSYIVTDFSWFILSEIFPQTCSVDNWVLSVEK